MGSRLLVPRADHGDPVGPVLECIECRHVAMTGNSEYIRNPLRDQILGDEFSSGQSHLFSFLRADAHAIAGNILPTTGYLAIRIRGAEGRTRIGIRNF